MKNTLFSVVTLLCVLSHCQARFVFGAGKPVQGVKPPPGLAGSPPVAASAPPSSAPSSGPTPSDNNKNDNSNDNDNNSGSAGGNGNNGTEAFIFDPPLLDLKPSLLPQNITVKMAAAPKQDVTLQFEGGDVVQLDKCQLKFTSANFGTPQTILAYPAAASTASSNETSQLKTTLNITTSSCDPQQNNKKIQLPVNRQFKKSRRCSIFGDPHFKTFDKRKITFFGKLGNTYTVMKSPRTSVQMRMAPCTENRFCGGDIAIRHMDSVMLFQIDPKASDPNAPNAYKVTEYGPKTNFDILSVKSPFRLQTQDGVRISITVQKAKKSDSIFTNANVAVPGFYSGSVAGLCGNFDGNKKNDEKDQKKNEQLNLVPKDDDLFECKDKCPSVAKSSKPASTCAAPEDRPKQACGSQPEKPSAPPTKKDHGVVTPPPLPTLPPSTNETDPRDYCKEAFDKVSCADVTDKKEYIDACVFDAVELGDSKSAAETALNAFMDDCASAIDIMRDSPVPEEQLKSKDLIDELELPVKNVTLEEKVGKGGKLEETVDKDTNGDTPGETVKFPKTKVCDDDESSSEESPGPSSPSSPPSGASAPPASPVSEGETQEFEIDAQCVGEILPS